MFLFCSMADKITQAFLEIFKSKELVTVLISILPIVEARGAIPIAFSYGISPPLALLYAFIGSSLMAPVLIAVLLPFVKWLSKTKMFRKVGQTLYEKFESKSKSIVDKAEQEESTPSVGGTAVTKRKRLSSDAKKMLGIFAFVAIPLPLTGVWTGSAVAALTKLPYPKALIAVVSGNLVATSILTLLCFLLPEKAIDWVILVIGIIAVIVVLALILKIIFHKPTVQAASETDNKENE